MSRITSELRKLTAAELTERIAELKKEFVQQKQARAAGELSNPHAIKKTRRQIAIANTLLGEIAADTTTKKEEA